MRLTVLGSSASYAGAGQACSGHLVETGTTRVLLDCGNGVLSNLARVTDPLGLAAVFVTHEHVDHFADIYALQALLRYSPSGPLERLPLYAPRGVFERMGRVLSDRGRIELADAFLVNELAHDHPILIGDMAITPMLVDHADPTFALRVESAVGIMCYSSDTAPGERAVAAARGCDLLLAEATLPEQFAGRAPHMTAREAGQTAQRAGVRALVLTHIWPTNDRERALAEACESFSGRVTLASEFEAYDVCRPGVS